MAFHGNESQDRYKWYQSPHLGLSPAGYGGGISGGYYSHYPAYPPHTLPNFTQPNPYSPPQHHESATIINGHLFPLQYPYGSQANTQFPPPLYSQPIYQQPFITTPQNPITTNPPNPSCPTYHSSHSNPNLWIYPPVSPNSAPPLTSYQQQPSSTSDVKEVEPDLHLGSISRELDRVHDLEGPNQNFGYSSFTPEPMHRLKESGNLLAPNRVSGELPFKGQTDGKLCATRDSLKKSMDTFMSEFKEELQLLRDSWKLQASHVDSALKKFESPPQSSTLEPGPATAEASSLAILSSIAEPVSTAVNAGLDLSQHDVILGFTNEMGTEDVASAISKVSPYVILDLNDDISTVVVSGVTCKDDISIGLSDKLDDYSNKMDACVENRDSEIVSNEGVKSVVWENYGQLRYSQLTNIGNIQPVGSTLLRSIFPTSMDVGDRLFNDCGGDKGLNELKGSAKLEFLPSAERNGCNTDANLNTKHGESTEFVEKLGDLWCKLNTGHGEYCENKEKSGIGCLEKTEIGNEAEKEVNCGEEILLVGDSFLKMQVNSEMVLERIWEKWKSQVHEMVLERIWEKWKSQVHAKLASEGNAKELDPIVREGLKLDIEMVMCSAGVSEVKCWEWLYLCHFPVIFHRVVFHKIGDPLSQRQATSIIQSSPYHINPQLEDWNIIHAMMYEEGFLIELFGKPRTMKVEALTYANLGSDDTADKLIPQFLAINMYIVHYGMGQTGCAYVLSSLVDVYDAIILKGMWGRNVVSWSVMLAGFIFVKGACGVGLSISGKNVTIACDASGSSMETDLDKVSKDEICCKYVEDVWGVVRLVLGLSNSVSAVYKVGARDVSLKVKDIMISSVPHMNNMVQGSFHHLQWGNDKACDFGGGPLFNILPLLIQPTLEDQERYLLVKGDFQRYFSDYLSEFVASTMGNLESSKCVSKEVDIDFLPLNSDMIASYYFSSGSKTCELMLGGISTALEDNIVCYCDGIMIQLLRHLSSSQSHRLVKPILFSCFDDPQLTMILYLWEIKARHKSMEYLPFEESYYPAPELIYIFLGLGSTLCVITCSVLIVADIALGATTHGHMLHDKVLDYSSYAYDSLDVLTYDLGDNNLAALYGIDSTIVILNTSATAFDSSMASQQVKIADCPIATLLGSLLIFGTLLICTIEFYISVPLVGRYGQVLQETSRLEDKPVL